MRISIIIPAYNEEQHIGKLVTYLYNNAPPDQVEIIVADGGSTDNTVAEARTAGAQAFVSQGKGRSVQMNEGVRRAKEAVYFFVHADTLPPAGYYADIAKAVKSRFNCGSFRFKFMSDKWYLKINSFFTRFNYLFFRGGDQGIFVTSVLFKKVGGFNNEMRIMEDYDFLKKIWESGNFTLIQKDTLVSARKYDNNSWLKVQLANLRVVRMYKKGAGQQEMIDTYHRLLQYRKNAF